jgi:hypothetical protein
VSGPIARVPIAEVQAYMGDSIKRLQEIGATGQMLQIALSICEYLKDAQRWRYVEEHYVEVLDADMGEMLPSDFREWVDLRLKK